MDKLRLRFEKTGRAIYISHLDLMRVVQRVFLRAGVPLRYSEGFNPHPLISICLPLSVGTESLCELMDFRVREDIDTAALPEKLNAAAPGGIRFTECYEPQRKAAELKWLCVEGLFEYDGGVPEGAVARLAEFFARESVPVTRRTKRGEGVLELAGNARGFAFERAEGGVRLLCTVSAQEPTVNPELLAKALEQAEPGLAPDFAKFRRLETYDSAGRLFR